MSRYVMLKIWPRWQSLNSTLMPAWQSRLTMGRYSSRLFLSLCFNPVLCGLSARRLRRHKALSVCLWFLAILIVGQHRRARLQSIRHMSALIVTTGRSLHLRAPTACSYEGVRPELRLSFVEPPGSHDLGALASCWLHVLAFLSRRTYIYIQRT